MSIDVAGVARTLGGKRVIGKTLHSMAELDEAVQRGLPKEALVRVAEAVFTERAAQRSFIYDVVPEATFKRRRDRLSAAESEKTERLARIVAHAFMVWGDEDAARRFLLVEHPLLGGRRAIDVAMTEIGARQVEELIHGLEYGLPV
ncbi:MAG TPA: antitoxin Xre/MbcA/ParS toxin-binding domain-containing protein [Magnetospirillaceae bacterium]|jgi:putative toxin-antitoxin system antitoxin component (TIGR02293 family)